jgi:hypothetical protein
MNKEEIEELEALLKVLQSYGVHRYATSQLRLDLGPVPPAHASSPTIPQSLSRPEGATTDPEMAMTMAIWGDVGRI